MVSSRDEGQEQDQDFDVRNLSGADLFEKSLKLVQRDPVVLSGRRHPIYENDM